jgi:hypothetical protein
MFIFAKLFPNKYAYSMQERKKEVTFTKEVKVVGSNRNEK